MEQKIKIKIILGSTRQGRFGERPAKWLIGEFKTRNDVEVELLDLKDYSMPFFDSQVSPSMLDKKYSNEIVQRWSNKIDEADAFIMISPEYNHGYSAVIKNALDWLSPEWHKKAVGFVSYGSAGGARAIEQLREVAIELRLVPITKSIHIPWEFIMKAMNSPSMPDSELFAPLRNGSMGPDHFDAMAADLIWMACALKVAREAKK